ncbi:15705_t:CDS:1 [Dentiscutata erythropus]|uniref:15705_t:CDS:1 n=1 Tax=Dentiscutata erythropus TaxID=1348616 RepID=A0A9N9D1H6_9GLOM|nr:15705_t:CDS:1 [Dentiscutata erythropus]
MCNWCCKKKNECLCSEYNKEKPPHENCITVEKSNDEYNEWKNKWEWGSTYHKNYKWYELCYEAKWYSKCTSHNFYDCRYRKMETEPFVKKVKCLFCSKKYSRIYYNEGFLCLKSLHDDDPRRWNPNWYKENN